MDERGCDQTRSHQRMDLLKSVYEITEDQPENRRWERGTSYKSCVVGLPRKILGSEQYSEETGVRRSVRGKVWLISTSRISPEGPGCIRRVGRGWRDEEKDWAKEDKRENEWVESLSLEERRGWNPGPWSTGGTTFQEGRLFHECLGVTPDETGRINLTVGQGEGKTWGLGWWEPIK